MINYTFKVQKIKKKKRKILQTECNQPLSLKKNCDTMTNL